MPTRRLRVLVTGARGFVGRHVMTVLASTDIDLHAVTSSGPLPEMHSVTWHRADLLDRAQIETLLDAVRPDTLLHLAWCAKPPHYWRDIDNVRWTSASLELARLFAQAGGTRIVAAGTCAEYDWRFGYCVERTTPLAPTTLYGAAKAACGSVIDALARELGFEAAWARLFFLLGPHDAPGRLVPSLVARLNAGEVAQCTSGGLLRDYLYIKDAAEALVTLAATHVTGPVNIGSGVPVRIDAIATAVAERMGRPDLLRIVEGSNEHPLVAANVERLTDEVGWKPRFDLTTAVDETVRWWTSPAARAAVA
jgi:nucleoside-diphosphate-sugar epimerase